MKLEYIDEGKGEVIVFVHSYLWDKEMWRPQVEHLKEKYKIGFYENIIKKLTNIFWELIESSS